MSCFGPQKIDDAGQPVIRRFRTDQRFGSPRSSAFAFTRHDGSWNFSHRKHDIDDARQYRIARHSIIASLVRILGNDEAPAIVYFLEARAPIRASSRKDQAHRALAKLLREGMQQEVEG